MTVLVTGAAGLIGAAIVWLLLARGERVVALDRTLNSGRLDEHLAADTIVPLQADITDARALDDAVAANGVTRIIHTAAALPPASASSLKPIASETPRPGPLLNSDAVRLAPTSARTEPPMLMLVNRSGSWVRP